MQSTYLLFAYVEIVCTAGHMRIQTNIYLYIYIQVLYCPTVVAKKSAAPAVAILCHTLHSYTHIHISFAIRYHEVLFFISFIYIYINMCVLRLGQAACNEATASGCAVECHVRQLLRCHTHTHTHTHVHIRISSNNKNNL